MDYIKINRRFWDKWSREKGPWSRPVSKDLIEKAKSGRAKVPGGFPKAWLPESWKGLDVLGAALAGGQQMPVIAALGADVTSFDISEEQLKKDKEVCAEAGLEIKTQQGEMERLSAFFRRESFDLIINGVSVCYTKKVKKVWREIYRTLRPGGVFLTGFNNPCTYSFDTDLYEKKGEMKMIHKIPCSSLEFLPERQKRALKGGSERESLEFSHSLSSLIGGQTEAGFKITGLCERRWRDLGEGFKRPIDSIMPSFIYTKAVKQRENEFILANLP